MFKIINVATASRFEEKQTLKQLMPNKTSFLEYAATSFPKLREWDHVSKHECIPK